jgi:hypothetical protein
VRWHHKGLLLLDFKSFDFLRLRVIHYMMKYFIYIIYIVMVSCHGG